jgi:hypothetical protein
VAALVPLFEHDTNAGNMSAIAKPRTSRRKIILGALSAKKNNCPRLPISTRNRLKSNRWDDRAWLRGGWGLELTDIVYTSGSPRGRGPVEARCRSSDR